jgi:ketosteroid isomerase-like protein
MGTLPMPKQKPDVNKSEEIRKLFRENPKMPVREVRSTLAARGIKVSGNLVYYIKGKMKGRKGRSKKARQMVARVAATGNHDPVKTILRVKGWANEVGGLKKLKELVDALSE